MEITFDVIDPKDAPFNDCKLSPEGMQFLAQFGEPLREGKAVRVQLNYYDDGSPPFAQVLEWLHLAPSYFARYDLPIYARFGGGCYCWLVPIASDPMLDSQAPGSGHASPPAPERLAEIHLRIGSHYYDQPGVLNVVVTRLRRDM
ncbi:MAG: hypothetical protein KAV00_17300 [Phycisphaerae bacterium]|nr:hypothetical protein [Phycisphaerae bacterium]